MATMNKQTFVREAVITIANHISTTGKYPDGGKFYGTVTDADREDLAETLEILFDILDKDGYYVGRRGVKY